MVLFSFSCLTTVSIAMLFITNVLVEIMVVWGEISLV